jgi:hypothetical protein
MASAHIPKIISANEDVEKGCCLLSVGMSFSIFIRETSMQVIQIIKYGPAIRCNNVTTAHIRPKEMKSLCQRHLFPPPMFIVAQFTVVQK